MSQFRTTIETDDGEREVVIIADFCEAERGDTDGPRGPKLEPDVPAHWEVDAIYYADNNEEVPSDVMSWESATEHVNTVTAPWLDGGGSEY